MKNQNTHKKILFILVLFITIISAASFASALSLLAQFEDGYTSNKIMPGDSSKYYVMSVADQGLDQMHIKAELYDETTDKSILLETLFDETTSETFFYPDIYTIIAEQYNNLPGSYVIKITSEEWLTNEFYTSSEKQLKLEVIGNRPPVANFTYSPNNPTTITPVTFTSTSYDEDGYLVKKEWFVDGVKIGEGQTITYTFIVAGSHDVMLKVTDNEGATDTETKTLIVASAEPTGYPVANFTFTPISPSVNQIVTFTSNSYDTNANGYIVKEEWDLNNDGIFEKTGHIVSTSFPQAGTYIITLKVTDNSNLQASISKQVIVVPVVPPTNIPPKAEFVYVPTAPIVGNKVTFTSTSTDIDGIIVSQDWYVDGILVGNGYSLSQTFTSPRTYTVKLVVTDDDGAQDTETKYVVVKNATPTNIPPVANFTFIPVSPFIGDKVVFTSTSYDVDGIIVSYKWFVDGFFVGNQNKLNYSFSHEGTHTVKLVVTDNDGAQDFEIKSIVVKKIVPPVNIPPVAEFIFVPTNPVVNEQVIFTSTSYDVDGTIVSYKWYVNGAFVGSQATLQKTFTNIGIYMVKLVVTDDDGAQDSTYKFIFVKKGECENVPPVANFTYSPQVPVQGDDVKFISTSTDSDGTIILEEWFVDGVFVSKTHAMNFTFNDEKTYTIMLRVTDNDGAQDTENKQIIVGKNCRPNAVLKIPESVIVGQTIKMDGSLSTAGCNATISYYEWKIYKKEVLVAIYFTTEPYQSYTFNSNMEYRVVLTVYTNTHLQDSDEKLVFAGRPHQGVTIGQEDGLFVDYFDVVGSDYGVISCGKEFTVSATVTNNRDDDIRDLKITFAIPELGYELESEAFDLDSGDTETVQIIGYLDMMKEEVPAGEYIALIGASDTDTIRNKYFPLMIR